MTKGVQFELKVVPDPKRRFRPPPRRFRQTRLWRMLDKRPTRLTYMPKRRGDYFRTVIVEIPLYEGLIDLIVKASDRSV